MNDKTLNCDCFEGTQDTTEMLLYYKALFNSVRGSIALATATPFDIKDVKFDPPATIVLWEDGTKTVVMARGDDVFDPEKGLALAMVKKAYGNKGRYFKDIKKYTKDFKSTGSEKPIKHETTWRKLVSLNAPDRVNRDVPGEMFGCTNDRNYFTCGNCSDKNCTDCWNRLVPAKYFFE